MSYVSAFSEGSKLAAFLMLLMCCIFLKFVHVEVCMWCEFFLLNVMLLCLEYYVWEYYVCCVYIDGR